MRTRNSLDYPERTSFLRLLVKGMTWMLGAMIVVAVLGWALIVGNTYVHQQCAFTQTAVVCTFPKWDLEVPWK